jgi:hypothetical protein
VRTAMNLKLIGIVLMSTIGFAQAPTPDPVDIWRKIRSALITPEGDKYFRQIKDAVIPPDSMFAGKVVSRPSPKTLVVNVENPAGDAILKLETPLKSIDPGTRVYFNGAVDSYVKEPYILTLWGEECREGPESVICEIR